MRFIMIMMRLRCTSVMRFMMIGIAVTKAFLMRLRGKPDQSNTEGKHYNSNVFYQTHVPSITGFRPLINLAHNT